ncbi:hypothetical protein BRYFOR_09220 [Marvinbryantia formatexigens DSM 14469]|uniref:Uncharacterized protein n=1 Tax=Marvinbryantia formatexigens DSM 14469 TaxID=478749 RepID=C6LKM4_9FIRM|nr:hypothetical protein [Marvinbryantia formatexigens]EET58761.1 hypothetical protein BRYFOR_09220 [Marvinbryantia formatexigens DSM 14469]UWO24109.1 hypothetical protein NQ534_16995 [Marvinbryantia formatexigens DSM 14469]SDG68897.1 hypothetical protein SAMN05660368_03060 [Marvinbryantia formatexigens]
MSQAKVDRYKQQKANRQKIMKKEKRERMLWRIGGYVVLLVLVCWIGVSAYNSFHVETRKFYDADTTAIDTYLSDLTAADDTAEAADEDVAADDTAEAADEDVAAEDAAEAADEDVAAEDADAAAEDDASAEEADAAAEADTAAESAAEQDTAEAATE